MFVCDSRIADSFCLSVFSAFRENSTFVLGRICFSLEHLLFLSCEVDLFDLAILSSFGRLEVDEIEKR